MRRSAGLVPQSGMDPGVYQRLQGVTADSLEALDRIEGIDPKVAYIGDDGTYSGPVVMANTVWVDLLGDVTTGTNPATSLTYEAYRDTPWKCYHFRHNLPSELSMRFQMPHAWRPNTRVHCHMHWVPLANPAAPQVMEVTGYYAWSHPLQAMPALASWTAFTSQHTVNPGDNFKQAVSSLFESTPSGSEHSSMLNVYVKRDGGGDTYTTNKTGGTGAANVALLYVDVHVQIEKFGTKVEF